MKRSTSGWTTAIAAAAFIGLPAAGFAQNPASPQTQPPPTTTQSPAPQAEQPPATPQADQPSAAPAGQVDKDAAKRHLSEARESLSQLAALPEAAKLQGETRTQVSQLISSFNELITTQNDWKAAYQKVDGNVSALLGPENGEAAAPAASQPTGTAGTPSAAGAAAAGTTGSSAALDPAIRTKLQEFRTHLKEFEQSAGGGPASPATSAASQAAMSPSVSTESSSSPAAPAPSANPPAAAPSTTTPAPEAAAATAAAAAATPAATPAPTASGTPGATGTSGSMAARPTDAGSVSTEASTHLDAISDIISKAKNGKLDKEQTEQIKVHVDQLKQLLNKQ